MAHGIEGRVPFLDHKLTEYVDGLPPSVKIRRVARTTNDTTTAACSNDSGSRAVDGASRKDDGLTSAQLNGEGNEDDDDGGNAKAIIKQETRGEDQDPTAKVDYSAKHILRLAAQPFITNEVYTKRKQSYIAPFNFNLGGPLHRLMKRLITEENVTQLGLLEWRPGVLEGWLSLENLVDSAFGGGRQADDNDDDNNGKERERAFRIVICLAQWVVLGQKFGVAGEGYKADH